MKISINNYNYSHATDVAIALKKPLFKLVSNAAIELSRFKPWENRILRIAKIASRCLALIAFSVPASLLWFAGQSISKLSSTTLDHEGLWLTPPSIRVPELSDVDDLISLFEISTEYKKISSDPETTRALENLCEWVINQYQQIYPDNENKRALFCKELTILLKNIIKKFKEKEFPDDMKRAFLIELATAATKCYPTWLEVATKLYLKVSGQEETTEVKLLRLVQEYKEMIILEYSQQEADEQWHALNYIRNILKTSAQHHRSLNKDWTIDSTP